MRLKERTLREIRIVPRLHMAGSLGGRAEQFFETGTIVRAAVLSDGGTVSQTEKGLLDRERLRLLVPEDTSVSAGDAAIVAQRKYVVLNVQHWSAHLELICEART